MRDVSHRRVRVLDRGLLVLVLLVDSIVQRCASSERGGETREISGEIERLGASRMDDARGVPAVFKVWCGVRGGYRQREDGDAVETTCDDATSREPDRVVAAHALIASTGSAR